ncbi:MAG: sensor histidine kinase [Telluria sp.]
MQTYTPYHGPFFVRRRAQRRISKPSIDDLYRLSADRLLNMEQMFVNEALVAKVFRCEKAEAALRASEKKLNELLAHQSSKRDEERTRIARDIHDSLGQKLLALRIDISVLHTRTSARHPRLHSWVGTALDNLDSTIESARQILADMHPFQLELGLVAAVEWELNRFERRCGLHCNLSLDPRLGELMLQDEQTLALYRALQECLNNIVRHSLANRVNVLLEILDNTVLMNVRDNGIGFDVDEPRKKGSFGLLGIKERMAALGGHLIVASSRSHGTAVTLSVPFAHTSIRKI